MTALLKVVAFYEKYLVVGLVNKWMIVQSAHHTGSNPKEDLDAVKDTNFDHQHNPMGPINLL